MYKLEKLAQFKREKTSDTALHFLDDATRKISLTPEEYEKITKDTEAAIRRKQSGKKASQANRAKGISSEARKTGSEKEYKPR